MVQRVARQPKPHPRFIEPMECRRVPKLPEGDLWVYEPKQDGYRIIAVIDGRTSLLHSMHGQNYTAKYPHIAEALKWLNLKEAVFDGEVVALDPSGRANFQELQNARLTKLPIIYYVFDLLHLGGRDLLDRPLSERRKQLEQVATGFRDPLRLNPSFHVSLADFTESVQKLGLEGIVAKRSDSIYIPGKESDAWRKHRFNQEDEFVIGGYIPGGQNFSELLIGEERGKELWFIKRLTAGFVPHTRAEVFEAIKGLKTTKCPFSNLPESRKSPYAMTEEVMRQCAWVKPERRCEADMPSSDAYSVEGIQVPQDKRHLEIVKVTRGRVVHRPKGQWAYCPTGQCPKRLVLGYRSTTGNRLCFHSQALKTQAAQSTVQ